MAMHTVVEKLKDLLNIKVELRNAVINSLQQANEPGLGSLEEFYQYLNNILTHIPTEEALMPSVRKFYYVLDRSPDGMLKKDPDLNAWINEFVQARGSFMDTPESTATLDSFINNPEYKIEDYIKGPSGWLSYNQFLARQLKPGKRPVAERCNDSIIVSPADSTFMGTWKIEKDATITVKGETYAVNTLLAGSAYKDAFNEGIFTHSFLAITDYHRFHVPVSGIIKEVKKVPAATWITETKKPDGSLENTDDVGFQFAHTRAHMIIESPIGLVAVMPVGMGHISSVVITAEEGTRLEKGDEFGYFAFGGSDLIMLFDKPVTLTAKTNTHYKQGEQIGAAALHSSRS
jgi:phosphatidylserine decarboxylase precursor